MEKSVKIFGMETIKRLKGRKQNKDTFNKD